MPVQWCRIGRYNGDALNLRGVFLCYTAEMSTKVVVPIRLWRMLRLIAHLLWGVILTSWLFPRYCREQRVLATQRWSASLLRIAQIRLRVIGKPDRLYPANTLMVANHVSWLDIFVMNAAVVSRFVAKSEIRDALDWQRYRGTDKAAKLMPPADAPQHAALEEALQQNPQLLEQMRALVPGLFDF